MTSNLPFKKRISEILFILISIICLMPFMSSGVALVSGMLLSLTIGNPFSAKSRMLTPWLLQASVVGLGAGMSLKEVSQVGLQGFFYTAIGISLTLFLGLILGKLLNTEKNTSLLVSVGTAICGGSAIAAVSSTIRAKAEETSMALMTVFLLNASALFIFPPLGHFFELTQYQFGLLAALAIHDTSSVVGAALQYGPQAVEVATTVKLARALWIVPVSFVIGFFWNQNHPQDHPQEASLPRPPAKRPWFILGFLAAAALVTFIPELRPLGEQVSWISKRTLVLTLFLIGCGITQATLRTVGLKPFFQGILLWVLVTTATFISILLNWIH